jgi:hypothetical protein
MTVPRIGYCFVELAIVGEELWWHPERLSKGAPPSRVVTKRTATGDFLSKQRFTSFMIAAC